jgi:uncharacterized protein (TIGR00251 family)
MKFKIKVHPNSSQEKISVFPEGEIKYEIWIKEKPIDGKANSYIEKFLKKEFGKKVKIVSGFNSRIKIVEI